MDGLLSPIRSYQAVVQDSMPGIQRFLKSFIGNSTPGMVLDYG